MTGPPAAGQGASRDFDLFVIGDINPDILVVGDDVTPTFGQVEKLVSAIRVTVGGSSAIMACGAARLGLRVAHGGVVGDDAFGRMMLDELAQRGVDVSACGVDPAIPTGATLVLNQHGERALLTATGTIDRLAAVDVSRQMLARARHLHAGSTAIQPRLRPGLPALFREARAMGLTCSFDPNWDPDRRWEGTEAILAAADVCFPNAEEARRISGRADPLEAAHELVRMAGAAGRDADAGPLTVALKMGAEGALVVRGEQALRLPAPGVKAVDTTGAGDAFDAGFLAGFLAERTLEESLALAVACGTLSTRALGGVEGQATLEEAEALL